MCGIWISSSIAWELVTKANMHFPLRPTESENLRVGPNNLCFNKHSR